MPWGSSPLFSGSQKEFDRLVSSKICSTTRWEDITSWPNSYSEEHGNFEIYVSLWCVKHFSHFYLSRSK